MAPWVDQSRASLSALWAYLHVSRISFKALFPRTLSLTVYTSLGRRVSHRACMHKRHPNDQLDCLKVHFWRSLASLVSLESRIGLWFMNVDSSFYCLSFTEGIFRAHLLELEKENSQANGVSDVKLCKFPWQLSQDGV